MIFELKNKLKSKLKKPLTYYLLFILITGQVVIIMLWLY